MNETRALARFVAQTRFTDLPRGLVDNCKITVLDAIGAGFVGAVQPWARRIVAVVRALGGAPEASVIQQEWRTDVSRAALANGVLIGAFECEPLTGSHASGTVLPAALAVCQRERFDGAAFLTALALGFEVSARLARTAVGLETVRGFHNPGTQGPFGAAVAVGKLYGLDEERLASAMGIAGSSSAGLLEFAWSGGDTKRLHLGRATERPDYRHDSPGPRLHGPHEAGADCVENGDLAVVDQTARQVGEPRLRHESGQRARLVHDYQRRGERPPD